MVTVGGVVVLKRIANTKPTPGVATKLALTTGSVIVNANSARSIAGDTSGEVAKDSGMGSERSMREDDSWTTIEPLMAGTVVRRETTTSETPRRAIMHAFATSVAAWHTSRLNTVQTHTCRTKRS